MFYVEVILEPLRHCFLVFLFFIDEKNTSILNTTIDYIHSTKRVDVPLTNFWFILKHLYNENISFKFYYLNVKLNVY